MRFYLLIFCEILEAWHSRNDKFSQRQQKQVWSIFLRTCYYCNSVREHVCIHLTGARVYAANHGILWKTSPRERTSAMAFVVVQSRLEDEGYETRHLRTLSAYPTKSGGSAHYVCFVSPDLKGLIHQTLPDRGKNERFNNVYANVHGHYDSYTTNLCCKTRHCIHTKFGLKS